jgi:hypothetical protein
MDFSATRSFRQIAATADDNPNVANAGPCTLTGIQGFNAKASTIYLKLYNKKTAPSAADTPMKSLAIPANAAFVFDFSAGYEFPIGLAYRVTGAAADADNTALLANDFACLNLDMARG